MVGWRVSPHRLNSFELFAVAEMYRPLGVNERPNFIEV